ncbi:DNase [Escherichia coli]|nr:DNase [Escherichia coli]EEQ2594299.1 DNase [Escherichia coli]EEQ3387950.1 DNase [Escherichia coli]EEV8357317.1 DNase [Escherichia coli]EEW3784389.1 DNase [Escherichia coli]
MARSGPTESLACDQTRGGSSGEKNDRPGHRAPSHAEKKFPFQGS